MLVLRCTTKVLRKVGGKPRAIEESAAQPTFGEWYVNTVDFINRGDLLACMHVGSLYVLFVPVRPKATGEQLVMGLQSRLLTRLDELETRRSARIGFLRPTGARPSYARRRIEGQPAT